MPPFKSITLLLLPVLLAAGCKHVPQPTSAMGCFQNSGQDFSSVLTCYAKATSDQPPEYKLVSATKLAGIEKRVYALKSQEWDGHNFASPGDWMHTVDIYIPDAAQHGQALLVANNGTNLPMGGRPVQAPTDFTEASALTIARQTNTIVIVVSNVPNQYLTYSDDGVPRREDDSVAHSWKLFLQQPEARPFLSLHIPMMQSVVQTMNLAQRELKPWGIDRFIASGASKRGWAVWMAALADSRVSAIAPFVIDILNTKEVLNHTYRAYGASWPLAFNAYFQEGITEQVETANFAKLMQVEDPLLYANTPYGVQLAIPKYIINASSDDFFVPDSAKFYFDALPGKKMLRVAPNASHYGIQAFVENSLVTFTNRLQQQRPLPALSATAKADPGGTQLSISYTERPATLTQWRALNAKDRDFRHPCGIRYETVNIDVPAGNTLNIDLRSPDKGWSATFIEATMGDGMVISTPVQVLPDTYPDWQPTQSGPACRNLSGVAAG